MSVQSTDTASTSRYFYRASGAALREAWSAGVPLEDMSRRFGMSVKSIRHRVVTMGLPLRGHNTSTPKIVGGASDLFREMWLFGVVVPEIGRVFKVNEKTVQNTRRRLGLEARRPGRREPLTAGDFFQDRLRRSMAATAMTDQNALLNAEMVDQIGPGSLKRKVLP